VESVREAIKVDKNENASQLLVVLCGVKASLRDFFLLSESERVAGIIYLEHPNLAEGGYGSGKRQQGR